MTDKTLEIVLAVLEQMEATLVRLREMRGLVPKGNDRNTLDELIEDEARKLAEIKHRIIQ